MSQCIRPHPDNELTRLRRPAPRRPTSATQPQSLTASSCNRRGTAQRGDGGARPASSTRSMQDCQLCDSGNEKPPGGPDLGGNVRQTLAPDARPSALAVSGDRRGKEFEHQQQFLNINNRNVQKESKSQSSKFKGSEFKVPRFRVQRRRIAGQQVAFPAW